MNCSRPAHFNKRFCRFVPAQSSGHLAEEEVRRHSERIQKSFRQFHLTKRKEWTIKFSSYSAVNLLKFEGWPQNGLSRNDVSYFIFTNRQCYTIFTWRYSNYYQVQHFSNKLFVTDIMALVHQSRHQLAQFTRAKKPYKSFPINII